jgi:hypothetical protein
MLFKECMETKTKKKVKKSAVVDPETRIELAYMDYLLDHGDRPASVFKFCQLLGIKEDEFYDHLGSFTGLERKIWKDFIEKTVQRLHADEAYTTFSSRERMLAFYYTLFEELRSSRSFVLVQLKNQNKPEITPEFLKDFKATYESFIEDVLNSGQSSGEVAKRPFLDKRYPQLFWIHMGFILFFWKNDSSPAFEKTDAAIEKSVNLAFDLISKGAVDSMIDFAKFIYQTNVK